MKLEETIHIPHSFRTPIGQVYLVNIITPKREQRAQIHVLRDLMVFSLARKVASHTSHCFPSADLHP